jgi:hypothetical protein
MVDDWGTKGMEAFSDGVFAIAITLLRGDSMPARGMPPADREEQL